MFKSIVGAALGVIIGYYIPPGMIFWGIVGAISGYLMHRYSTLD